jgi:hypothetical protein
MLLTRWLVNQCIVWLANKCIALHMRVFFSVNKPIYIDLLLVFG